MRATWATCATRGCAKPAKGDRLCAACRKRLQRRRRAELASEREASLALVDAAEDLVDEIAAGKQLAAAAAALDAVPSDVEHDGAFLEAKGRLERAAEALCLARGWLPPGGVRSGHPDLGTIAGDRRSSNG